MKNRVVDVIFVIKVKSSVEICATFISYNHTNYSFHRLVLQLRTQMENKSIVATTVQTSTPTRIRCCVMLSMNVENNQLLCAAFAERNLNGTTILTNICVTRTICLNNTCVRYITPINCKLLLTFFNQFYFFQTLLFLVTDVTDGIGQKWHSVDTFATIVARRRCFSVLHAHIERIRKFM